MSTDGGALVYGVGEDASGQPRLLTPIALKGAAERIDQVAQHSVSGSLQIRFQTLRYDEDPGRGFLIAEVPASPLAPHQVKVGNDRRFYGRSDTGNRLLSEAEIERLYERRRRLDVDREALLADCIAASPLGSPTPHQEGFLQAFVHPAIRDEDLWDRALAGQQGDERRLLDSIREAATAISPTGGWGGAQLGTVYNWRQRGADKWSLDTGSLTDDPSALKPRRRVLADLGMDGRCYLFQGGAADIDDRTNPEHPIFVFHERGTALALAQFLGLVHALYEAGGQFGPVDVGIAVTGLRGAVSVHLLSDHFDTPIAYGDEAALRTMRLDARDLEDPVAISIRLLDRLLRAMSNGVSWNPLTE